jgi:hypothetical protein
MADGFINLVPDGSNTGQKADMSGLTVGANTVIRQRMNIADPLAATGLATVGASNAALSETALACLRVAGHLFALDTGAGGGSQQVPLQVQSTATPNLRVSHYNAGNQMPAGDALARAIFQQITDATTGPVFVTPASTAAIATNKALVVALHPTSPVTTNAEQTAAAGTAATKCFLNGAQFLAYGSLPSLTTGQGAALQTDASSNLKVGITPLGTPVYGTASSGGAAAANVTLAAVAAKMLYLDGFDLDGLGATAGSAVSVTVVGLLGGTLTFTVGIPAGATVPFTLSKRFNPPLQASAVNTAIVVNNPSWGSGNTASTTNAYGHYI